MFNDQFCFISCSVDGRKEYFDPTIKMNEFKDMNIITQKNGTNKIVFKVRRIDFFVIIVFTDYYSFLNNDGF